jgi:hypothetical protein
MPPSRRAAAQVLLPEVDGLVLGERFLAAVPRAGEAAQLVLREAIEAGELQ